MVVMEVELASSSAAAVAAAVFIYSPFPTVSSIIFNQKHTDKDNTLVNC